MPKLRYDFQRQRFGSQNSAVIEQANTIIAEYAAAGFNLTLRQLYYQFVARALIPNTDRRYKRLGSIVNDGRMAGLIDWLTIEDRTRNLRALSHWDSPEQIVEAISHQYRTARWDSQPTYAEVWIEKDALIGVIEPACTSLDVPYFSCRGYTSQSEAWRAGQRLLPKLAAGKNIVVFHLGDHDPSGLDMSRDIEERLVTFLVVDLMRDHDQDQDQALQVVGKFRLERLALNFDQVRQYDPPPNPTKLTDSRSTGYIAEHGDSSWELDALEPTVIDALIREAVGGILDRDAWDEATIAMEAERKTLVSVSSHWNEVASYVMRLNGQKP